MPKQVRLVFHGEVLPGADPAAARRNLAQLLGLGPQQLDAVFSGQRVVLKPALPEHEAARYVEHLAKLGVRALTEAIEASPAAPPMPPPTLPAAPAGSPFAGSPAAAPAADEQCTCPACGTVQPKRTLCRQCGAHIANLAAARAEAAAQAAAEREAEAEIRARRGGKSEADDGAEVPKVFSFDFSGRMGRMTYLLANFLISPITLILLLIALRDRNVVLMLAAFVLPAIINLRASVLRCHDLNWNGWLVLLSAIPYLGTLFWLILMLAPGSSTSNNFGEVPGRSPGRQVGLALLFFVAVAAFTVPALISEGMRLSAEGAQAAAAPHDDAPAPARTEAPRVEAPRAEAASGDAGGRKTYDGSINAVLLYTVGDCTPCVERRRELAQIGLWPREVRVDLNESASDEMIAKLVKAGLPVSSLQMPVIDVNGALLNNPSVGQVEQHLR